MRVILKDALRLGIPRTILNMVIVRRINISSAALFCIMVLSETFSCFEIERRYSTFIPLPKLSQKKNQDLSHSFLSPYSSTTTIPQRQDPVTPYFRKERMALQSRSSKVTPQVIFLADDPKAASRIDELLTTLYDRGPSSVTKVTQGLLYDHTITSSTPTSFHQDDTDSPQPDRQTNRDLKERFLRNDNYFPPRYRPSSSEITQNHFSGFDSTKNSGTKIRLPKTMMRVTHIEAECQNDFMQINVRFNGSFDGLIYSLGYSHDLDCVYVNGSGKDIYQFYIKLNQCGTLSSTNNQCGSLNPGTSATAPSSVPLQRNVMCNTLTVQYNRLIEEEWDEHFKVTCEYGLEIWKTVTFPFLDVDSVPTGSPMTFNLDPPECHMEIRHGFSVNGQRVSRPVRVGDPLTLVIYMRAQNDLFDIVISDCFAHNGGSKKIMLIDSLGCPVDEKLISHFEGRRIHDAVYETQIFAFFKTFRFTGSPALYLECGVRMCQGKCPPSLCHWSGRAGKSKRSVQDIKVDDYANYKSNISESLNLFQSLRVIKDEEVQVETSSLRVAENIGICMTTNHLSLVAGISAAVLFVLLTGFFTLCSRVRNLHKNSSYEASAPQWKVVDSRSQFVPPTKRRLQ